MLDEITNQNVTLSSTNKPEDIQKGYSEQRTRNTLHCVLASKGGVGKSLIASLITQYLKETGHRVIALDTDPVQNSLALVNGLEAVVVDLLDGDTINVQVMDSCIERIIEEDTNFVLDCGGAGFVSFNTFMLRDNLFEMIINEGNKRIVIHSIIVGGRDLVDTTIALANMIEQFPERVEFVCWRNTFFGELETPEGLSFDGSPWWQDNKHRFIGSIHMPKLNPVFAGAALRKLLDVKMTFAEAQRSPLFGRVEKMRLRSVWNDLKSQIWTVI